MPDNNEPGFRIEVTMLYNESKTYIYRDRHGDVHYVSPCEVPLALSNLVGEHAASMRFQLECCNFKDAVKIVSKVLHTIQITRGLKQPFARADWWQ